MKLRIWRQFYFLNWPSVGCLMGPYVENEWLRTDINQDWDFYSTLHPPSKAICFKYYKNWLYTLAATIGCKYWAYFNRQKWDTLVNFQKPSVRPWYPNLPNNSFIWVFPVLEMYNFPPLNFEKKKKKDLLGP